MFPMTKRTPKLAVGMKVHFWLGARKVVATLVEDRGPLGPKGMQMVRVRVQLTGIDETTNFEVLASDVQLAA